MNQRDPYEITADDMRDLREIMAAGAVALKKEERSKALFGQIVVAKIDSETYRELRTPR